MFARTTATASLLLCAASAHAALVQVASRDDFNDQFPGALLEDFEEARVPDGEAGLMENVLDEFTDNAIFHPGEIVPGLRISVSGDEPNNLFVSSPGFANYTSHAISFDDPTSPDPQITIDLLGADSNAFAMDVTSNPAGNVVAIDVFSGDTLLGSFQVVGTGPGAFFGVVSDSDPITRVEMSDGNFFGIDNVAFIPAPGTGVLLAGGLLLATRRRR